MRDYYTFYVDKLTGEYRETFRGIEAYAVGISADDDTMEEKMNELLDLFLNAQEEGKPVQKLVGKNMEHFCDTYFSDITWKSRMLDFFDRIKSVAWWILVFSILDLVGAVLFGDAGETGATVAMRDDDILSLVTIFLSTYILSRLAVLEIRHLLFQTKKVSYGAMWWIQVISGLVIGLLVFLAVFHMSYEVSVPVWAEAIVCSVYLIFYYIFNSKRVAARKQEKTTLSAQIDQQYPQTMMDTFHSKNKWRRRLHRPELTMEDYVGQVEKSDRFYRKYGVFLYYIFPAAVVFVVTIAMVLFDQFETNGDILWFVMILGVCEYLIFIPLGKMAKSNSRRVKSWLEDYYKGKTGN